MSIRRGDVVLVWFPHSDQASFSRRPALVLQADSLDTGLSQIIIAMITTNLSRASHPSRVLISASSSESTIGTFHDMTPVNTALRHTLGL